MLTSGEYQPGDRLKVTVEGVYKANPAGEPWLSLVTGPGTVTLRSDWPGVTVERLAPPVPEGWPGVPGSVWTVRGVEAMLRANLEGEPHFVSLMSVYYTPERVLAIDPQPVQIYTPLAEDEGTAAPLHTWPPTEAGQRFRDQGGDECESYIRHDGELRVTYHIPTGPKLHGYPIEEAAGKHGPMTPIPAPGGASC